MKRIISFFFDVPLLKGLWLTANFPLRSGSVACDGVIERQD